MNSNNQNIVRNAIFYSGSNTELYNDLKCHCSAEKINIIIAENLGALVNATSNTDYSILFIDANTKQVNEEFLTLLRIADSIRNNLCVIIDGSEYYEDVTPTIFSMSCDEVVHKIPDLKRSVKVLEAANGQIANQSAKQVTESEILKLLVEHGFDIKLDGFKYILSLIVLFLTNGKMANPLCKSAYPIVASNFDTKPENVERNIRNAIKQASKTEKFQQKLGHILSPNPTNSQVINYFVATQRDRFIK